MAKLVDARDLKSLGAIGTGSTPAVRTIKSLSHKKKGQQKPPFLSCYWLSPSEHEEVLCSKVITDVVQCDNF